MVGFPMKLDGFVSLLLACASWETFKAPRAFPFSAFFRNLMASDNGLQFEFAKFVCVCFDMVGVSTLEMIIPLVVHGSSISGNNFEVTKTARPTKLSRLRGRRWIGPLVDFLFTIKSSTLGRRRRIRHADDTFGLVDRIRSLFHQTTYSCNGDPPVLELVSGL